MLTDARHLSEHEETHVVRGGEAVQLALLRQPHGEGRNVFHHLTVKLCMFPRRILQIMQQIQHYGDINLTIFYLRSQLHVFPLNIDHEPVKVGHC